LVAPRFEARPGDRATAAVAAPPGPRAAPLPPPPTPPPPAPPAPLLPPRLRPVPPGLPQHHVRVQVVVPARPHVLLVRAREIPHPVRTDLHHPRGELAHEPPVVRDQDQRAFVALQRGDQRLDRLQVQMV